MNPCFVQTFFLIHSPAIDIDRHSESVSEPQFVHTFDSSIPFVGFFIILLSLSF